MRIDSDTDGPLTIDSGDRVEVVGTVTGDVTVRAGGLLSVTGTVDGSVIVETGGRAHLHGAVTGDVTVPSVCDIAGDITGRLHRHDGAEVTIHPDARINGVRAAGR